MCVDFYPSCRRPTSVECDQLSQGGGGLSIIAGRSANLCKGLSTVSVVARICCEQGQRWKFVMGTHDGLQGQVQQLLGD